MALKHPALPYVAPFAIFMALLALRPYLPLSDMTDLVVRNVVLIAALLICSRRVWAFRPTMPWASTAVGVAVFLIWITPDALWPGYRSHWLFQNAVTGTLTVSLNVDSRGDGIALLLRTFRAVALTPVIEELFWRGWLLRWLVNHRFEQVPLGQYQARAFWFTALLFASEHGPYWDVGLVAGAAYNAWIIRARTLGDVTWAHAVTNLCLSLYVIFTGRWEFWM